MLIELLILFLGIWWHSDLEFRPFAHGQKVVKAMSTTLGPISATGYLMTTLVICTHQFLPAD